MTDCSSSLLPAEPLLFVGSQLPSVGHSDHLDTYTQLRSLDTLPMIRDSSLPIEKTTFGSPILLFGRDAIIAVFRHWPHSPPFD